MKNIFFTLSILFYITTPSFAQWKSVLKDSNIDLACFALNVNTCFVGGDKGLIYKTIDGGLTWQTVQTQFKNSSISDIHFTNQQIGYACGGAQNFSPPDQNIILKTKDGGLTWDSLTSNLVPGYLFNKMYFFNDSVGLFGTYGRILKTRNGGKTFTETKLDSFFSPYVQDLKFVTKDKGFFVSRYSIYKTLDQGDHWKSVFSDSIWLYAISFIDQNKGFAVGRKGTILKTIDGGETWTKQNIGNIGLKCIQFLNDTIGYIGGSFVNSTQGFKYLAKTTDGGKTWSQQITSNEAGEINTLSFLTPDIGYIGGLHEVFKTTNGGITTAIVNIKPELLFTVFPNPSQGIIVIKSSKSFSRLEIFDINGQLKTQQTFKSTYDTKLQFDNKGIFFIKLSEVDGSTLTQKVIIE